MTQESCQSCDNLSNGTQQTLNVKEKGTDSNFSCENKSNSAIPRVVDTLIVGNGPSAIFLSYLLHGFVPFYDCKSEGPHPDRIIHGILSRYPDLSLYEIFETVGIEAITRHFDSNLVYAKQALRFNILLDALLRPNGDLDTDPSLNKSRIKFKYDPSKQIDHLVVGHSAVPGGQWSEDTENEDSLTLSYADMLSLPPYSTGQYILNSEGRELPAFSRLTRSQAKGYYATYPAEVGISDSFLSSYKVANISRISFGRFDVLLKSHNDLLHIKCSRVILASGLFSCALPPPKILASFTPLSHPNYSLPVLILGSGFTAADSVLYHLSKNRQVIHIYKWDNTLNSPSPLKACHPQAYPEYSAIYRYMKSKKAENYTGYPNAEITSAEMKNGNLEIVINPNGESETQQQPSVTVTVGTVKSCVGRRTKLDYLLPHFSDELKDLHFDENGYLRKDGFLPRVVKVIDKGTPNDSSKRRLGFEVMHNIWVIGSLTGDSSLVRFAFGGVVGAANDLLNS